jgi:hypothetical protein
LKSPHIVGLFCPYSRSHLTLVWSTQEREEMQKEGDQLDGKIQKVPFRWKVCGKCAESVRKAHVSRSLLLLNRSLLLLNRSLLLPNRSFLTRLCTGGEGTVSVNVLGYCVNKCTNVPSECTGGEGNPGARKHPRETERKERHPSLLLP